MLKNFINTGIIALKHNLIYSNYDRESKNKKFSREKGSQTVSPFNNVLF